VVERGAPDSTELVGDRCPKDEVEEGAELNESADVMDNGDECEDEDEVEDDSELGESCK